MRNWGMERERSPRQVVGGLFYDYEAALKGLVGCASTEETRAVVQSSNSE